MKYMLEVWQWQVFLSTITSRKVTERRTDIDLNTLKLQMFAENWPLTTATWAWSSPRPCPGCWGCRTSASSTQRLTRSRGIYCLTNHAKQRLLIFLIKCFTIRCYLLKPPKHFKKFKSIIKVPNPNIYQLLHRSGRTFSVRRARSRASSWRATTC